LKTGFREKTTISTRFQKRVGKKGPHYSASTTTFTRRKGGHGTFNDRSEEILLY